MPLTINRSHEWSKEHTGDQQKSEEITGNQKSHEIKGHQQKSTESKEIKGHRRKSKELKDKSIQSKESTPNQMKSDEIRGHQGKSGEINRKQQNAQEINEIEWNSRRSKELIGIVFCVSCGTHSGDSSAIQVTAGPAHSTAWRLTGGPWPAGRRASVAEPSGDLHLHSSGRRGRQLLRKRQTSYT